MKTDPHEIANVALPILAAEATVIAGLFIGAHIIISGQTLWGVIIGAVIGWWG